MRSNVCISLHREQDGRFNLITAADLQIKIGSSLFLDLGFLLFMTKKIFDFKKRKFPRLLGLIPDDSNIQQMK